MCLPNVCKHYYGYMNDSIYKILLPLQWQVFQETHNFRGSRHDVRDGFIHLCTGEQLSGTLSKHFTGVKRVVLARFCADNLMGLRWEISRDGEKFPHLYNPLSSASIKDHIVLIRAEKNEFVIPEIFLNS